MTNDDVHWPCRGGQHQFAVDLRVLDGHCKIAKTGLKNQAVRGLGDDSHLLDLTLVMQS